MNVITVEREYGSGGAEVAKKLSERLGWALWDQELTTEIAKHLKCGAEKVRDREERRDPVFYRLVKAFMRGSYEASFSGAGVDLLDAEHLSRLFEKTIQDVASRGRCVIVGRASTWYLRERPDVFHTFIYAPRDWKIARVMSIGKPRDEAVELVDTVDKERAAFVKQYFDKTWPQRDLYHLMLNSKVGVDVVVNMILDEIEALGAPQRMSA